MKKYENILSTIFHATMNYRLNKRRLILLTPEAEIAASNHMVSQPEPEDALLVPLEEYNEDNLRKLLPVYLLSFAKTYGLETHQRTPNFSAIDDFLSHRYNFWTDDIEHDDPFRPK